MGVFKRLLYFRCKVIELLEKNSRQIQTIMGSVDELLAEIATIKTNVNAIQATVDTVEGTVSNIDADVKGLIKKIEDGDAPLGQVLEELKGLSILTATASSEISTLADAAKSIADSVPDEPEPGEEV